MTRVEELRRLLADCRYGEVFGEFDAMPPEVLVARLGLREALYRAAPALLDAVEVLRRAVRSECDLTAGYPTAIDAEHLPGCRRCAALTALARLDEGAAG